MSAAAPATIPVNAEQTLASTRPESLWADAWKRLRRNRAAVISGVLLALIALTREANDYFSRHILESYQQRNMYESTRQLEIARDFSFSAIWIVYGAALMVIALPACNRSLSGSKLTLDNYNQISTGMSKAQVERILGPPTSMETKDMLIYKKTVYRYEDGKKFAIITFKNDEVDSKDTNLGTGA